MSGISLITKGFICPTTNIIKRTLPINIMLNTKLIKINSELSNTKINLSIKPNNIHVKQKNVKLLSVKTPSTNISLENKND